MAKDEPDTKAAEEKAEATAEAPKPKPKRKPAAKKTEGTAAAETGVDKAAAEAGAEGAEAPAKPKRKPAAKKPAAKKTTTAKAKAGDAETAEPTEEKPKATRSRAKKADEPKAEETAAAEAPKAEKPADKPAARTRPARRRDGQGDQLVTVRAQAKFVRTSARKARLVADHVRGKSVQEARSILAFSPRSVAEDWRKVLESAIANAEHNHDLVGDDLRVLNATADEGPTLKRFRPRAMGRATRIRKRTSHLTITLTPKD
jgi:ribosomal protein L22